VRVRVPASSANLGPGYDSFGLALGRHDVVTAGRSQDGIRIEVSGVGADSVARTSDNLVARAAAAGFAALGEPAPPLALTCINAIPHGGGQGSSAAAIVAGLMIARGLAPDGAPGLDDAELLALAARIEGHPDNVAAALLGGFTLSWTAAGRSTAIRHRVHPDIRAVLFTAGQAASTAHARGLLPPTVPHVDAAANAARAGLLVHAIGTDPRYLFAATEDRLHQQYRASGVPASMSLVGELRAAGVAAVISGAGPSVLALTTEPLDLGEWGRDGFVAAELAIDTAGAVLERW
jgi:homoserine kinase